MPGDSPPDTTESENLTLDRMCSVIHNLCMRLWTVPHTQSRLYMRVC